MGGKGGKGAPAPAAPPPVFEIPEFTMPEFRMPEPVVQQPAGPTYEEQQAELRRREGISQRDILYSDYMNAVSASTEFVNSEIAQEMANARLLGIDYTMTDEMKQQRISDYFASVWSEGSQAQLEALMSQYGDPVGFEGFMERGDSSVYGDREEGSETVQEGTRGIRPPTILEEEDTLEEPETILGG